MQELEDNLVGLFTTDVTMRVASWDSALQRMTGMLSGDVVGKTLVELVPDIASRGRLGRFERSIAEGTNEILASALHGGLFACSPLIPSRHFTEMRQHVTISPLIEKEEITGLVVTVEDVTARMERKIELAANLNDPDSSIRLDAARRLSLGNGLLPPELADLIIQSLGDPDWRVRRRLNEAMSRRAPPDAIQALLRALKEKHLDFAVVNSVLQILRSTDVATVEILIGFLKSSEADLRMHAALALGELSDKSIARPLVEALGDSDVNVRYHVIEALGKQKAITAVDDLWAVAEQKDFFLSFAALEAIGRIGLEGREDRMAAFLDDEILWEPAARALSRTGSPASVSCLVRLLNTRPACAVVVAELLGSLVDRHSDHPSSGLIRSTLNGALSTDGIENFVSALNSQHGEEIASLFSLAALVPDARVQSALAECMDHRELAERATAALVAHGNTAASLITAKLASDDDQLVCLAALALGEIGEEPEVDPLVSVLARDECVVAVARALAMIGGEKALAVLIDLAGSDDPERQQAGIKVLAELKTEAAIPRLNELLTHTSPAIRRSAIETCGRLGAPEFANLMVTLCQDANEGVRKSAIKNLREVAGNEGVQHIVRALKDSVPGVRSAAAAALPEYKSSEVVTALGEALEDSDPWTRYFAVRGLAKRRDLNFAARVRQLALSDSAEFVRAAANELLRELDQAIEPGA